jgi:hypothetical protein
MSWRRRLRFMTVLAAAAGSLLLTSGVAGADPPLPNLPPLPTVEVVIPTPSLAYYKVIVPTGTCFFLASYDNTGINPPGSVFRGQTACGSGVYQPAIAGQAVLKDTFGNVVAVAPAVSQIGGVGTSEGFLGSTLVASAGTSGVIPGLEYTVEFDTSVTLSSLQNWGAPAEGCTINGKTQRCVVTAPFLYIPGTKGGITPA